MYVAIYMCIYMYVCRCFPNYKEASITYPKSLPSGDHKHNKKTRTSYNNRGHHSFSRGRVFSCED